MALKTNSWAIEILAVSVGFAVAKYFSASMMVSEAAAPRSTFDTWYKTGVSVAVIATAEAERTVSQSPFALVGLMEDNEVRAGIDEGVHVGSDRVAVSVVICSNQPITYGKKQP